VTYIAYNGSEYMMDGISPLLILWAASIGAIITIFRVMDETATLDAKRKVADWIKSFAAKSISQTIIESPQWFIEAFDRIFGERHLTLRCFFRSCVASLLAVFVMAIMWVVLDPASGQEYFFSYSAIVGIILIFLTALILNLVPDYISLLETRWILHNVAHADVKKLIVFLVLDVIITGGIFACGFGIVCVALGESNCLEMMGMGIRFRSYESGLSPGVFFYSTYFTSVWLYLFIVSSIATKLLYSLGHVGNWVIASRDIEGKPYQSMGLITIGILTLFFAIYAIFNVIMGVID
jgi:hypothetical protein